LKSKSTAVEALATESTADPAALARDPRAGASPPGARRGIPWEAILARDDKNKDGKISREEFSGPPALFDRLDRNHDGFITREEHEAFQAQLPGAGAPPAQRPK
ncbi:MAG TPA: hypothetical protein VEO95_11220, partial [Chthoniobacteraceae bacterium]|nr:hypothetical protein [Chthoniobacteraceae bacterium]